MNILPFDRSVYQARLSLIQSEMADRELACLLLFNPENIYWLTGYQTIGYFTFQALMVPAAGMPVVIGRIVNRDLAMAHPTVGEFIAVEDTEDSMEVLGTCLVLRTPGGATIGLETSAWNFSVADYHRLGEKAKFQVAPCNGLIEPHRMVKSDVEIARLVHASRCAEDGLAAAIEAIEPGKNGKRHRRGHVPRQHQPR